MKVPLSYQATEYDCGPTTMMNAISFLFEREEIPPDVIKYIMLYCLDVYNDKGEIGKKGTSTMAMMFISNWLCQFGKAKDFPIEIAYLTKENVFIGQTSKIVMALQQGGVVVVRLYYGEEHYVLLTGIDNENEWIYLFDPYYREQPFEEEGIELIADAPMQMNRKVPFSYFNKECSEIYALGPKDAREAIILHNKITQKTAESTIEYFI
ncbi:peptidase C39-like protein [Desulfitobacterium sp. LBE]|uniref:C39 family peptidase n=1 Tax=Desulfitobacterium sp. LBE TaxID=884086 RepID=UPI00119B5126|nr:C39 family peptidase [Desulfitobacterium sp. LBE]TWH56730.1 peptidase C39-like protein [Desulfitobacterium sp. LBE]